MKTNPNPWFVDRNPPRNLIEGGYRPLTIDSLFGDAASSSTTLAAALFGNAAGFDFSRLIQTIASAPASSSAIPVVAFHDGVLGVVGQTLDSPLGAEAPTQHLSYEQAPDSDIGAAMSARPSAAAPVVSVGTLADLNESVPTIATNALATPLGADDPNLSPGRISDLGFLQNLPATAWVPQPGFDQPETAIRPSVSTVVPASSAPTAVIDGGAITRSDLIHELTPAVVADATMPLSLLFVQDAVATVIASDLFITDPAPLPDLDGVQFAAVLPDPIVDPGPLV